MSNETGSPVSLKLVLWIGVAAVVFSIWIAFLDSETDLIKKILIACLAELGFACVIAVIIVIAVDRREKQEFINYIVRSDRRLAARNLLAYVSDLDIPDIISQEVERYARHSPFIKNFQDYIVKIEEQVDDTAKVTIESRSEYQNISRLPQVLDHSGYLSKGTAKSGHEARGGFRFCSIELIDLNGKVISSSIKSYDEDGIQAVENENASGVSLEPGARLSMSVLAEKYCGLSGADYLRQKYLCKQMRFDFIFDRNTFDVDVVIFAPDFESARIDPTAVGMRVTVPAPFVTNNGVLFRWRYKRPAAN